MVTPMREWIGQLGHISIILAFVGALAAGISYFFGLNRTDDEGRTWQRMGRTLFYVHGIAVLGVVATLFTIIYYHFYEYHYAWSHSSNHLPVHFMISCFWEGQEGSFLLWIFWQVLLGWWLIRRNRDWEVPVMAVFALVQAFLCSMILGVDVAGLKLGSSPFILLRDAMPELPVWAMNPDFIPTDGRGLNPLLQNYWMVIHPPTLFLGFACTLIPFAFAMGGLMTGKPAEWVKPATSYTLFGSAVLGLGIMMGAYWAYETLNFGGYWNWDPVENAVYIPWLTLVAAFHTMLIYRKNSTALKTTYLLVVASFVLVLYATFLTRSGILGNASVHSFTDLGLSGQLLVYLLFFLAFSIFILARNWGKIPGTAKEAGVYSREFWLFSGATALCLASFQVLATTSIPVYNAIGNLFGADLKLAPPANQALHYSNWQLYFAAAITILSAFGQYFYWNRPDKSTLQKLINWPLIAGLALATAVIFLGGIDEIPYIILATACCYSLAANVLVGYKLVRNNPSISGGALAHIGLAVMLLGVLFSSGYSKVISNNESGLLYSKEFSTEMNAENVLLWKSTPTRMKDFTLTYKGNCREVRGFPVYVKEEYLTPTGDQYRYVTLGDLKYNDKVYFKAKDTVTVESENLYYAIEYLKSDSSKFMLYPRAQVNPTMGLLASPDVKKFWNGDLYTHVSAIVPPDEEKQWSKTEEMKAKVGDTLFINDYVAQFVGASRIDNVNGVALKPTDAAVKAQIRIFGLEDNYVLEPIFLVQDNMAGRMPAMLDDIGIKVTIQNIDPASGEFTFGFNTTQKDWVILKAVEKPWINGVWIGTIMVLLGMVMAIVKHTRKAPAKVQSKAKPNPALV